MDQTRTLHEYFRPIQSLWPGSDANCERNDILRNIGDGIASAVFEGKVTLSASSAPRVAHMSDCVEEMGADTHYNYRGRAYGECVVSQMTKAILGIGRTPICRTATGNVPSQRLAEGCRYGKFADSIVQRPG